MEQIVQIIKDTGHNATLETYTLDPRQTVAEKIKSAIRNCSMAIVLWTKESKGREWVIQEVGAISILNKPLVIFLDNGVEPPQGMAEGIHYVRFRDQVSLNNFIEYLEEQKGIENTIGAAVIVGAIFIGMALILGPK